MNRGCTEYGFGDFMSSLFAGNDAFQIIMLFLDFGLGKSSQKIII